MMKAGEGLLTKDRLEEYYDFIAELYLQYDYSQY